MAKLAIYRGDTLVREVNLEPRSFRIGRGERNDIVLSDPERSVSRTHADLRFENGRYVLVDLNSANGLWVADRRVPQAQMEPGVLVELGMFQLALKAEPAVAPVASSGHTPATIAAKKTAETQSGQLRAATLSAPVSADAPAPGTPKPEAARAKPITMPAQPKAEPPKPELPRPEPRKPEPPKAVVPRGSGRKPGDSRRRPFLYAGAAILVLGGAAAGFVLWQTGGTVPGGASAPQTPPSARPSEGGAQPTQPAIKAPPATQAAKAADAAAPVTPAPASTRRATKPTAPASPRQPVGGIAGNRPVTAPPPRKKPATAVAVAPPLRKEPAAKAADKRQAVAPARPAEPAREMPLEPKARARELQRTYQASREAIIRGDYLAAVAGFEAVLKVEPEYLDAREMLSIARGGAKNAAQLEVDYGTKAEMEGDWAGAIKRFERALELDATATSPGDGIKRVRARMRIEGEELFKRARQLDATERAADAIAMYEKALQLLPADHPNARAAAERIAQLRKDL